MITENWLEISPAYGKDYTSAKAATEAFRAGKDFKMESVQWRPAGTYCSIRDFAPGVTVGVRYNKLQSIVPVKV